MKVLIVGGTGTIGSAVTRLLQEDHELIVTGKTSGALQVDIESKEAIAQLFENTGKVDAIISTAGAGTFSAFDDESDHAYKMVLENKIMGQINLARVGVNYLNKSGSITLTSGEAARSPMVNTAAIAMGCASVEAFSATVALELKNDQRINVVSPAFVKESMDAFGMDSTGAISADRVAEFYRDLLTSDLNGQLVQAKN